MKRWTGKFYEGQSIHVDTDNPEWGRIAADVEVLQVYYHTVLCYVPFPTRANVLIPKKDVTNILT